MDRRGAIKADLSPTLPVLCRQTMHSEWLLERGGVENEFQKISVTRRSGIMDGSDAIITGVQLNESRDKTSWMLEKSRKYTTKSMYRFLLHRGVVNKRMRRLWKNKMPMKVKVFMWLADQNRIQSREALGGRNWKGDIRCKICRVVNH